MPRPSRGFQGLLTAAPAPLPDDDEPQAPESPGAAGRTRPAAGATEPASRSRAGAGPVAAAVPVGEPGGQAVNGAEPGRPAPGRGAPAPSPVASAVERRVATTIRLRPAAAAALNSAWLYQRMHVNPKLSYPEFASEIVRLGLAAFERQAKRSLPAVALWRRHSATAGGLRGITAR